MSNLYGSDSVTAGFGILELSARLDSLLLTLKSCKGKICRRPWEALFPKGEVGSLRDAMDQKYDDFFLRKQPQVTFSECARGYLTWAEGALAPIPFSNASTA